MDTPADLKYTKDHEWLKIDGKIATIGITNHAQDSLGDIVFVELPETGSNVAEGEPFGVVESVKAVSDLYSPVNGVVSAVNNELLDRPELVNDDPYGDAWLIKVELKDASEIDGLMDSDLYADYIEEEK